MADFCLVRGTLSPFTFLPVWQLRWMMYTGIGFVGTHNSDRDINSNLARFDITQCLWYAPFSSQLTISNFVPHQLGVFNYCVSCLEIQWMEKPIANWWNSASFIARHLTHSDICNVLIGDLKTTYCVIPELIISMNCVLWYSPHIHIWYQGFYWR